MNYYYLIYTKLYILILPIFVMALNNNLCLFLHFFTLCCRGKEQGLIPSFKHAMPPELGGKWETE